MKWFCLFVALLATPLWGVTIHRSFRTREAAIGFGTGTAGVAYPVDARIDKAIDEARQKEAEKTKVIICNAWHFDYFDHTLSYVQAQEQAKKARLGLWAAESPTKPYDWRKNKRKM